MAAQAEEIAEQTASPLLRGTIGVASGQVMMIGGKWRLSLDRLDDGVRVLTQQCRGAAFEALVGRTMTLRSLEEIGELREVEERAREVLQISRALGNRYAELAVSDHFAGVLTVRGDTTAARERARKNLELWTTEGFHLQHLYSIRREVLCDLYEGNAARGYERLLGIWKELRRSQLLQVSLPRVDTAWLRGRLALAVGSAPALADASKCARQLEREGREDAAVYALLLHAGLRKVGGDENAALSLWTRAAEAAEKADMGLYAAAAHSRRGALIGGEQGKRELAEAETVMDRCGVTSAERWATIYAPAGVTF
jgi:hypothetical protein